MPLPDLDPILCRARQQRLLAAVADLELDMLLITRPQHVQWLTGKHIPAPACPAVALFVRDGHCILAAPGAEASPTPESVAQLCPYPMSYLATQRDDQVMAAVEAIHPAIARHGKPQRVGSEFSHCPAHHIAALGRAQRIDIEEAILKLRRKKDADELAMLRHAIKATEAMYTRAREIIEPGIEEITVYSELYAAAVKVCGGPPTACGNDYACGVPGGPPRPGRHAQEGELYILDLGPAYRGYHADNCRTIAVSGKPTDEQLEAWKQIVDVHHLVSNTVAPGKSCRKLFEQAKTQLDAYLPAGFTHHLGHAIGLSAHERPRINPNWDDTFEAGDFIAVEPGLYSAKLRGGIRLEQNYLVTEAGVELLSNFSLDLA